MTKEKLTNNLDRATESVMKLTREFCTNDLSNNYQYIVRPNQDSPDSYLTDAELSFHTKILAYRDKPLNRNEIVDLLWKDNKVPVWINLSVVKATDKFTTIELLTSRRLRGEADLNRITEQYPPFHPLVPLPPLYKEGVKFDINWADQ